MHGYPGGGGYYGGGGCSPCATGACGAMAPGGYPTAGLYGPGVPTTAYAAPPTTAFSPVYPTTAMAPLDTLSTY